MAVVGLGLGLFMVYMGQKEPPAPLIPYMPGQSPYISFIAADGIIEAASENIPIGVPVGEVVEQVFVTAGDFCKAGDLLFQLDTRVYGSQVKEAEAAVETAKAELAKLIKEPRPEEVPPLEASTYSAEATWNKAKAHLDIYKQVTLQEAISQDEYNNAIWDERIGCYNFNQANSNLALKLAGAWIEDITIASKTLAEREATLLVAQARLDQTRVRAPFDGQVLQVKLYPGSFAQMMYTVPYNDAMLLYGQVNPLHVRINIDEEDAWRFIPKSAAVAFVRGNRHLSMKLSFVRFEPYVVPKRSLTGDDSEQTDTRVLQVIYSFDRGALPVYIGQLVDIFIEAPPNIP